ncbi:MAG: hypothetical protein LRY73_14125 [Bacillus sp. (in: Bacteria)]|nr:hypothetical protein [Bacillus sp. (in: firmicutes)]
MYLNSVRFTLLPIAVTYEQEWLMMDEEYDFDMWKKTIRQHISRHLK